MNKYPKIKPKKWKPNLILHCYLIVPHPPFIVAPLLFCIIDLGVEVDGGDVVVLALHELLDEDEGGGDGCVVVVVLSKREREMR